MKFCQTFVLEEPKRYIAPALSFFALPRHSLAGKYQPHLFKNKSFVLGLAAAGTARSQEHRLFFWIVRHWISTVPNRRSEKSINEFRVIYFEILYETSLVEIA